MNNRLKKNVLKVTYALYLYDLFVTEISAYCNLTYFERFD